MVKRLDHGRINEMSRLLKSCQQSNDYSYLIGELVSTSLITLWEKNFLLSIKNRSRLTNKQIANVNKIVYRAFNLNQQQIDTLSAS